MKNFLVNTELTFVGAGTIYIAISEAMRYIRDNDINGEDRVTLKFNGVVMPINRHSTMDGMLDKYNQKFSKGMKS